MGDYLLTVLTLICIYCILGLALNIVFGYAGLAHLGITVYMGIGAYATAIFTKWLSFSFPVSLLFSILLAAVLAGATGLFSLRVRDDSLTVITISMAFVFESLLINLPYFGGAIGIPGIPRPGLFASTQSFFMLALICLLLTIIFNHWLVNRWIGMAWQCIREDEETAATIGINPSVLKIMAFVFAGLLAGLSGVLYAHFMNYVSPFEFGFLPSVYIMAMVVFGGKGTLRGPLIGVAILMAVPELFRFIQEYRNLVYGGLLILMMLVQPVGILGTRSYLWEYLSRSWLSFRGRANDAISQRT